MATAPATAISLETYLATNYRPDVEYIDGDLKEKPVVAWVHGTIQSWLSHWFWLHGTEWGVEVAVEVRTRVSDTRVRLPDVVVDWAGPHPSALTEPPLLVIEILSPQDTYSELQERATDYQRMGIKNVWLIDPATRTARSCERDAWVEKSRLQVEGSDVFLELATMFAELGKRTRVRDQPASE